jgi:hypothetical protein
MEELKTLKSWKVRGGMQPYKTWSRPKWRFALSTLICWVLAANLGYLTLVVAVTALLTIWSPSVWFTKHSVGFPDVAKETLRLAKEYGVDPEFIAHIQLETALAGKSKLHVRETKYKAIQWSKLNRPKWSALERLDQVSRVVAACSGSTPLERMLLEKWETGDVLEQMHTIASWTVKGIFPGGGKMPEA